MAKSLKYWTQRAAHQVRWFLSTTRFALRQASLNGRPPLQAFAPVRDRAVLIVEGLIPAPDKNAGDRNIFDFVQTLVADGRHVIFWPLYEAAEPGYIEALTLVGAQVIMGPNRPAIRQWLNRYQGMLERVMVCRPQVAARWLPQSTAATLAKTVYYGHDLHFDRMFKQADISGSDDVRAEAMHMKRVEAAIWRKVPRSLYPTIEEVNLVRTLEPRVDVRHVQIFCFDAFRVPHTRPAGQQVLFVAGFRHAPNVDAAIWLASRIFPLVLEQCPEARLTLVGSHPTAEVRALASKHIEVTGWVSAEALDALYATGQAAVVPLRFGAGLKLKVVEALANGVPLVTTSIGAQGLDGLEHVSPVADHERDLADALIRILSLTDAAWLDRVRQQSDYVEQRFSRAGMRSSLIEALAPLAPAELKANLPGIASLPKPAQSVKD